MSHEPLVAQLEARLERERRARRQAEVIAERGMRELWELNRQLNNSVGARTAQVERVLAGLDRTSASWADELSATAREIGALLPDTSESDDLRRLLDRMKFLANLLPRRSARSPMSVQPVVVADEILHRWQRRAAHHGQLLSVEADAAAEAVTADWDALVGVAGLLLSMVVNERGHGALLVELACGDEIVLRVRHEGAPHREGDGGDPSSDPDAARDRIDAALTVAARLVDTAGGTVEASLEGAWSVEARLPIAAAAPAGISPPG